MLAITSAVSPDAIWGLSKLSYNLRTADLREMATVCPEGTALDRIINAVDAADEAFVLWADENTPIVVVGVSKSPMSGWGVVWLLASTAVSDRKVSVVRICNILKERWVGQYPCGLHCLVDSRNSLHLRWLSLLGFATDGKEAKFQDIPFYHHIYPPDEELEA